MCCGENNAPQAAHYLNAQLTALWENSQGCVSRHSVGLQPDQNYKYCFALSEFYYGKHRRGQATKADMMFYASFDKPKLDFICNHDAVFRISLREGHYNTEFTKLSHNPANFEYNRAFAKAEVAFRVPFSVTGIRGQDLKLGDSDNLINLLVLDYEKARLVSVSRELEAGREALAFYLSHYLKLLRSAGQHVLFSLPDFDDDRRHVTIDFSANGQALFDVDEIYGVSVEKINTYLSSSWLRAAMLASGRNGPSADRAAISLSEYRSSWVLGDSNVHFHVKLGAPRIRALCEQEVVLYFTVDEVLFYDSADFTVAAKQKFNNWEIAVLVNVIYQKEEEGNVIRCKLDLNTVRFMRQFCEFPGFDQANEESIRYVTRLVDFFTSDYLDILESAQYHVVYHYDERWPKLSGVVEHNEHNEHEEVEEESESEEEVEISKTVRTGEVVTAADGTKSVIKVVTHPDGTDAVSKTITKPDGVVEVITESVVAGNKTVAKIITKPDGTEACTKAITKPDGAVNVITEAVVAGTKTVTEIVAKPDGTEAATKTITKPDGVVEVITEAVIAGTVAALAASAAAGAAGSAAAAVRRGVARSPTGHAGGRIVAGKVVSSRSAAPGYVSKATAWKDLTEKTEMGAFDHITAISQDALNAHFKSLWLVAQNSKNAVDAVLARWTYEQFFSSTFQPITLRLLSHNKVLVWVSLQDGWLKTLKNWLPWGESEKYKFENWRLAFEVEIKMVEHDKLEGVSQAWTSKFEDSFAFKEHGKATDRVLKHIYLDFKHAEFIHEFSNFDGLFNSHDKRPIDKVQALVTYLQAYYFSQIVGSGYHVLFTIPVWKSGTALPASALTDVTFQIYSQTQYNRHNWGQVTKATEPVMLLLGMTNFRAFTTNHLKYSSSWVIRASRGISYGTVCLSKNVFLDEKLLALLARLNAVTTVVTLPFNIERGAWKLQLTTWAQSESRKGSVCKWILDQAQAGLLKYKWEHRDSWRYEHEGSTDITNGAYSVDCFTKNYLEIPTSFKHGALEIKLRGQVFLSMSVKGAAQNWSASSAAKWHTTLSLQAEAGGLKIHVLEAPKPEFEKAKIEGEVVSAFYTSPETLLKANLPASIDLGEIVGLFKSFEGIWGGIYIGTSAFTLAQPVFTKKGDIMFELYPHTQISASAPVVARVTKHHSSSSSRTTTVRTSSSVRPSMFSRPSLLQRVKNTLTGDKPQSVPASPVQKTHLHIQHSSSNGNGSANGDAKPTPLPAPVKEASVPVPAPAPAKEGSK